MKMTLIVLLMLITSVSQSQNIQYDVAVSFNSIGTGTPSDDFLLKFYKKQKRSFKKMVAFIASGCGREGEFSILINTKGMKSKEKVAFYKKLKLLVLSEEKKNVSKNPSSGHIVMIRKVPATDFSHCRAGIVSWPQNLTK